mmetsp:Transcript_25062/g.41759  ORF Transcript_25062/g.41759 Transcript_25062/m.41759 type:complete len:337 (-) Transcript_25062:150-1160(-)|eukprot:CAMPEP_0174988616 /NCGR_PEP_ID=MMETSP0004_2-20121128/20235_1 /TAXON_ID=420556 /ORGANISM="Ochromonas sp., Strain CCMP1393" /LENGTH=336 /DNA_ID=CAMNT_0016241873 /DNA_START=31 /DNA_END=1041 /DNA_ORIENTATION=+
MSSDDKIPFNRYYREYHGHRVSDLAVVKSRLEESNNQLIYLAGDSSLDNKYWFSDESSAVNGYEDILKPPKSREDIAHWMNTDIIRKRMKGQMAVINCAIEESTVGARSCGTLMPQDLFIKDNIRHQDILVISVGGNDIALKPTPCTACSVATLLCCSTTNCLRSSACGCALPIDDCCYGCACGAWSNSLACPPGLGYLVHLFGVRIESLVKSMLTKTKPKLVLVCMIYFLDETPGTSWAETVLNLLGYNRDPAHLQEAIRQIFRLATQRISIPGTKVIAVPLFKVLDGKNTQDYCERVEPSASGGEKMGKFLVETIQEALDTLELHQSPLMDRSH